MSSKKSQTVITIATMNREGRVVNTAEAIIGGELSKDDNGSAIFHHYDNLIGKRLSILVISPLTKPSIKYGTDRPDEVHGRPREDAKKTGRS